MKVNLSLHLMCGVYVQAAKYLHVKHITNALGE
jgi:hypothetical protein